MTSTKTTHTHQDIVRKGVKTKGEEKVEWGRGEVRGWSMGTGNSPPNFQIEWS